MEKGVEIWYSININMDLEKMEGVGARIGLIWQRIETAVGPLCKVCVDL
jgi:hypothetical protein